jgi:hypothetical protein
MKRLRELSHPFALLQLYFAPNTKRRPSQSENQAPGSLFKPMDVPFLDAGTS